MRQKFFLLVTAVLGSLFFYHAVFSASGDIVINEIGAYTTGTHEWIEIWNKGSEPVDLTGWKFWENNTNHSIQASDSVVSPGEYAVIVQDGARFLLDYPAFAGSIFDSSWSSLNESGEEIGLKDEGGNEVEKFTYIGAPDFSLERRDPFLADYTSANWRQHTSGNSVGAKNCFSDETLCPVVVIPAPVENTTPNNTPPSPSPSQGQGNVLATTTPVLIYNLNAIVLNELYPNPPGVDTEEES